MTDTPAREPNALVTEGLRMAEEHDDDGLTESERALAKGWYGYGRWGAPYWFVGIEPGGDELDACVRMWDALECAELLDIAAHHEEHGTDWFGEGVTRTQPTWQKLIWLLMHYQDREPHASAVLEYQKKRLGRADEETALIELSALPAYSTTIARPRMLFRAERVNLIRKRLLHHQPEFAVFYSPDNGKERRYVDAWNAITGHILVRDVPVLVGRTACVMTYHPNGKWSKDYWRGIAETLRGARASAALT
jgi:hypothetical protein